GVSLVFVNVEDGIKLGDLQQILDAMSQIQQLQMPAAIGNSGIGRHELSDSRAVDIRYVFQVQEYVLVAILYQITKGVAQGARTFAQRDPPRHVDDGDIPYLPSSQLYTHDSPRLKLNCWAFH